MSASERDCSYAEGFRDARAACHEIALQWIDGDSQCDGTVSCIADDIERLPGLQAPKPGTERMTGLCTDKAPCAIATELRRALSETVTRADLPSYSAELLAANYPTRTDASILSGPYTPTYIAAKRIEVAEAERDQLASMDDAAMDKMQTMIREQSERIVAVASYAAQLEGAAGRAVIYLRNRMEWPADSVMRAAMQTLEAALAKSPERIGDFVPETCTKDWLPRIAELSEQVAKGSTGYFSAMQQLVGEVQADSRHQSWPHCELCGNVAVENYCANCKRDVSPHQVGRDVETLISIWSMRPKPGTPTGQAWEDGCRQGFEWGRTEFVAGKKS